MYISGVTVGTFIAFEVPKLENGFVRQESHAGEIETYEEDRSGTMPKIVFKLRDQDRIFTLRHDYEVRTGNIIIGA